MKRSFSGLVMVALCLALLPALARDLYEFETAAQRARFQELTNELRCLVCQGQSIADSNADLAVDLREKVQAMILAGSSDRAIRDFMTQRYGDFVLYRPPLAPSTVALWFAPAILGVIAVGVALIAASRRRRRPAPAELSAEERRRLGSLGVKPGGRER